MVERMWSLVSALVVLVTCSLPAAAQDAQAKPMSALAVKTQALEQPFSLGLGANFLGANNQIGAPYFAAHLHGVDIPNVPLEADVATGALLEIGKATLGIASLDDLRVSLWSTERIRVGNVVGGADIEVFRCEFDSCDFSGKGRMVTGYTFNKNFSVEAYFFEPDQPVSASLFYRFGATE